MLRVEYRFVRDAASPVSSFGVLAHSRALAVATEDGRVTLWSDAGIAGDVLIESNAPVTAVTGVADSESEGLAIADEHGRISLAKLSPRDNRLKVLRGRHDGPVRSLAVIPSKLERLLVSAGDDGAVKARGLLGGEAYLVDAHDGPVTAMCLAEFEGSSVLVTSSQDGTVMYLDPTPRKTALLSIAIGSSATAVCSFSQRGATWVAAGCASGAIVLWPLTSPEQRRILVGPADGSPVVSLAWVSDSPFPMIAALHDSGALAIWSIGNESLLAAEDMGGRGVAVVEPLGPATLAVAYGGSWAALELDLDLFVLDLESPGTGA